MKATGSIQRSSFVCGLIAAMLVARSSVASPPDEYSTSGGSDVEHYVYSQAPAPIVDGAQSFTPSDGKPDATKESEAAKKKVAAEKKKKEELKKKVATAYKDPFYQNDFSYLKNPNYSGYNLDVNSILTFSPPDRFTVLAWYHYMFLANGAQGPYNITKSAFNPGGTVGSRDLGHEIDLLGTYKVNARSDLVLGYSHFFSGKYYDTSLNAAGAALFNPDADFLYSQWHYNF